MSWITLAIALFQVVNKLLDWARDQKSFNEGEDHAVAVLAQEALRKSATGRKMLAFAEKLTPDELDDWLRKLEPVEPKGAQGNG